MLLYLAFIKPIKLSSFEITELKKLMPSSGGFIRFLFIHSAKKSTLNKVGKSRRRDLNPRPADYESAAIPLSHDDIWRRENQQG